MPGMDLNATPETTGLLVATPPPRVPIGVRLRTQLFASPGTAVVTFVVATPD